MYYTKGEPVSDYYAYCNLEGCSLFDIPGGLQALQFSKYKRDLLKGKYGANEISVYGRYWGNQLVRDMAGRP